MSPSAVSLTQTGPQEQHSFNWRRNVLNGTRKWKAAEFKSKIEMPS